MNFGKKLKHLAFDFLGKLYFDMDGLHERRSPIMLIYEHFFNFNSILPL